MLAELPFRGIWCVDFEFVAKEGYARYLFA